MGEVHHIIPKELWDITQPLYNYTGDTGFLQDCQANLITLESHCGSHGAYTSFVCRQVVGILNGLREGESPSAHLRALAGNLRTVLRRHDGTYGTLDEMYNRYKADFEAECSGMQPSDYVTRSDRISRPPKR